MKNFVKHTHYRSYLEAHSFVLTTFLLLAIFVDQNAFAQPATGKELALPTIVAKSAIVVNRKNGAFVGSKNPDERLPIGSTTKIMTALVVLEAIEAGLVTKRDKVRIYTEKTNGKMFKKGTHHSVNRLLKGLMVSSANEAALSLAVHIGSKFGRKKRHRDARAVYHRRFVKRMNKRARELKMGNTHFSNPHGRDPEDVNKKCTGNQFRKKRCKHYSTARDLAKLTRFALKKRAFRSLVNLKTMKFNGETYSNTNKLLRDETPTWRQSGWITYGVKTGTTNRAGHCLVAAARKGPKDVIVVVLGSTRKWRKRDGDDFYSTDDEFIVVNGKQKGNGNRFSDTKALLKWADEQN